MSVPIVTLEAAAKQLGVSVDKLKLDISAARIHIFRKEARPGNGKEWCMQTHDLNRIKTAKKAEDYRLPKPNEEGDGKKK